MDSTPEWPLETRLVTIFKVESFQIEHHTSHEPYFQISVGGFVLDGWGEPVPAGIELCVKDGDIHKVHEFETMYSMGSIHRLDTSLFGTGGGCFQFHGPETEPVPQEKYDILNKFFMRSGRQDPVKELPDFHKIPVCGIANLCEKEDGSFVRIVCKVTGRKEIRTKQGALMGFAMVSDLTGESKVTLFADVYSEVSNMIKSDDPLIIAGKLELGEEGPTIILSGPMYLVSNSRNLSANL